MAIVCLSWVYDCVLVRATVRDNNNGAWSASVQPGPSAHASFFFGCIMHVVCEHHVAIVNCVWRVEPAHRECCQAQGSDLRPAFPSPVRRWLSKSGLHPHRLQKMRTKSSTGMPQARCPFQWLTSPSSTKTRASSRALEDGCRERWSGTRPSVQPPGRLWLHKAMTSSRSRGLARRPSENPWPWQRPSRRHLC